MTEREQALVDAADELLTVQDAIDNWRGEEGPYWYRTLRRRQDALRALSAALSQYKEPTNGR